MQNRCNISFSVNLYEVSSHLMCNLLRLMRNNLIDVQLALLSLLCKIQACDGLALPLSIPATYLSLDLKLRKSFLSPVKPSGFITCRLILHFRHRHYFCSSFFEMCNCLAIDREHRCFLIKCYIIPCLFVSNTASSTAKNRGISGFTSPVELPLNMKLIDFVYL